MRLRVVHERASAPACPDCSAARLGLFEGLIRTPCAFQCLALEERAYASPLWYERHAFAVVRRGVFVRERVDANGTRTAVDAVGPGGLVPLRLGGASGSGYAATRTLLCVHPDVRIAEDASQPAAVIDLARLQQLLIERVERIAEARGLPQVEDRVVALLVTLRELVHPSCPEGVSELQQRDLAALLQLRPETVCRALRALSARGAADGEDAPRRARAARRSP